MSNKKIGIIGYGNMGSAIAERIKAKYPVSVFDKDKGRTTSVKGIDVAGDIHSLAGRSEIIILAVKPQDFSAVLSEIKEFAAAKLVVSIAAGITTGYIEKILGKVKVVRVMPNMPAKIGKGVSCISRGEFASLDDLKFTEEIFSNLGEVFGLDENRMNEATAISGSGPGYYCEKIESYPDEFAENPDKFRQDFIKELAEAAKGIGFDDITAKFLASFTVVGTDMLLKNTAVSELKKMIASKGGTTQAALEVLSRNGTLADAVKAAVKRATELSKV